MRLTFVAVAVLLIATSSNARADCFAAPSYDAVVTASTVSIDVDEGAGCGSAAMLRQNIDTGEIVQLAAYCDQATYLDECVPAGRYRYGLASPLPCEGCGGTPFFAVAVVSADAGSCALSAGDAGATPFTGAVPWSSATGPAATDDIDYVCTDGPGCSAGGKLRVHVFDSLALLAAIGWSVRRRRSRR